MTTTNNDVAAYPLAWPTGWKRTQSPVRAQFHRRGDAGGKQRLTIADSRDRLIGELTKLGATGIVISSNLRLRTDGWPMGAQAEPSESGVCVYFKVNNQPRCMPCDRWNRAADNLAAISKHVEAMRGQLRWGVGSVDAAFAGFKALPGPGDHASVQPTMTVEQAAQYVAGAGTSWEEVRDVAEAFRAAYRLRSLAMHPDRGGDAGEWAKLQRAVDILQEHHGRARA